MSVLTASAAEVCARSLGHLLRRIDATAALDEPFGHIYLEDVFPDDVYEAMLHNLPSSDLYGGTSERHHGDGEGQYVRTMCPLTTGQLTRMPGEQQELWRGVAAALTAPELKEALYARLARDLAFRYGVSEAQVPGLAGHSRPTLYSETEGFEIPPHPDTRKKIVTMHLYLPADRSQVGLGTALYKRRLLAWPFGDWRRRFEKVKQFAFLPNSGYAFVVNNALTRKSWHGREELPAGAGVRNTLLNTFYEAPRAGYGGYLE